PAEPHPLNVHSGDPRADVQSALAMLAPQWGFGELIDISDEEARDHLARASVMALSFVAQAARGIGKPPVPQREIDQAKSIPERFLLRWRGEADPNHVKAIDAYWISAAEHGMNASTFTARVVASTGARRGRRAQCRGRRAERPTPRRRAEPGAEDARRGRRDGRRRALRQGSARPR
ncbi:MAG TPA: citrate/2-methylcitrate synthase, partial [Solirubrobacteraceae bacterium]|nr:citrate/2-methylcitrate synthase [Solirubrobacteraceae bacterium]